MSYFGVLNGVGGEAFPSYIAPSIMSQFVGIATQPRPYAAVAGTNLPPPSEFDTVLRWLDGVQAAAREVEAAEGAPPRVGLGSKQGPSMRNEAFLLGVDAVHAKETLNRMRALTLRIVSQ